LFDGAPAADAIVRLVASDRQFLTVPRSARR
jgi:hypothetical protein